MQTRQGWRWLRASREPITWAALRTRLALTTLPLPRTNGGRLVVVGGVGVLLLKALLWYASGEKDDKGVVTYPHASLINPILGGLGALFLIYAAIRQAQVAADRHEAQTKADQQRRITESFSKAVEQLGSDKLELRLGAIFALERLSKESPDDYWTIMEVLAAFVRDRMRYTTIMDRLSERAYFQWLDAGRPEGRSDEFWIEAVRQEHLQETPTDITAILTVIRRRSAENQRHEEENRRQFDLRQTYLMRTVFRGIRLERAIFVEAHLEEAYFRNAHLEEAVLRSAHLERAHLRNAHLDRADLSFAYLKRAFLSRAHLARAILQNSHLEEADLSNAFLEGANLEGSHLEGANLSGAVGLADHQLLNAFGDGKTRLPKGITRPDTWPPL